MAQLGPEDSTLPSARPALEPLPEGQGQLAQIPKRWVNFVPRQLAAMQVCTVLGKCWYPRVPSSKGDRLPEEETQRKKAVKPAMGSKAEGHRWERAQQRRRAVHRGSWLGLHGLALNSFQALPSRHSLQTHPGNRAPGATAADQSVLMSRKTQQQREGRKLEEQEK